MRIKLHGNSTEPMCDSRVDLTTGKAAAWRTTKTTTTRSSPANATTARSSPAKATTTRSSPAKAAAAEIANGSPVNSRTRCR